MSEEENKSKKTEQEPTEDAPVRKKDKYRKPKPWDNDPTLDKFKEEEFKPEDNPHGGVVEESSFAVLFP